MGVQCDRCGVESPPGKRFCGDCGAPFDARCPECGADVDASKAFCGDCGHPLRVAEPTDANQQPPGGMPAEAVAERRQCSVVFVDLVGFTSMAEGRDPEDVREFLSRYFELASLVITRYGGVIEKFIGDAVMAVWGTPVATEQDAERAVRAALDLLEAVGQLGVDAGLDGLAARAGVLTGEVAVTLGAVNEGMVAGEAVNTAARIQSVAPAGAVFVDGVTRRLTEAAVVYRDEGEHELKGRTASEQLWRAMRVVSNIGGEQRVDGLEAPLVGRTPELRAIRDMFHVATDRRQPRMMVVTGVAGVGKSRLGWEFDKYIDGLAGTVLWHRGRCLSYGDGLTYWAVAEAVRQRLGIAEEDPPEVASLRIADGLARYVSDVDERAFIALRLGRLLGVSVADDTGQTLSTADLYAGWRRLFERLADHAPVALVVEDAHHAAPELLDFLDHLVDWARDLPIFVLVLARPEIGDARASFGSGRHRVHVALDPLDNTSMGELVDQLVPEMPVDARAVIIERAQGVPLYAMESIRALIDRDVVRPIDGVYALVGDIGHLEVPESLTSLLAARLDSLEPVARRVTADASVLGASFPFEALVAISRVGADELDGVLAGLVRRGVFEVSADRLSPERGNFRFAQEMLRQVAYESLSRRDRKTRHLAVATHLRTSFPNDGEEVVDAIARHYFDAFDAVPDDDDRDEVDRLGCEALLRAGRRAQRTGAIVRAMACYEQLGDRALAAGRPLEAAEHWMRIADLSKLSSRVRAFARIARAAVDVYDGAEMPHEAARARVLLGRSLRREGQLSEARSVLAEAWQVVEHERTTDTLEVANQLSSLETFAGDIDAADRWTQLALDLAQEVGADGVQYATAVEIRGLFLSVAGQLRLAAMYMRESVRLYEQLGDIPLVAQGYFNLNNVLNSIDPREGLDAGERGLAVVVEHGIPNMAGASSINIAFAHLAIGDWDAAYTSAVDGPIASVIPDDEDLICFAAFLRAMRGDSLASDQLARLEVMDESEDPQDLSAVSAARAFHAANEGDAERALEFALVCVGFLGNELSFGSDDGRWAWPLAARLAHETGRYELERELVQRCRQVPLGALATMQRAEAALIEARLAALDGDERAGSLFADAVASQRALSTPYHLAHGLLDHAEFLGADDDRTTRAIAEALEIGERLRCRPLIDRAAAISASMPGLVPSVQ